MPADPLSSSSTSSVSAILTLRSWRRSTLSTALLPQPQQVNQLPLLLRQASSATVMIFLTPISPQHSSMTLSQWILKSQTKTLMHSRLALISPTLSTTLHTVPTAGCLYSRQLLHPHRHTGWRQLTLATHFRVAKAAIKSLEMESRSRWATFRATRSRSRPKQRYTLLYPIAVYKDLPLTVLCWWP